MGKSNVSTDPVLHLDPVNEFYVDLIAKVCHQVNKAFCEANGDHTQKDWSEAEGWQRESSVKGVKFALSGEKTPADQHAAWCYDKLKEGWVYGPVKDAALKTHPCLVPYGDLPEFQRTKDKLFLAIVNAMK